MKRSYLLILIAVLTCFTGLFNQLFMADSALYACVAKSFALSGNYLDIYVDGRDWLDKPHFSFWMEALSMELFGINSFAFKLPSFLFYLLSIFYTFLLARKLYDKEVALLAAVILASCVHIAISVNDVKVDAVLTGLVVAAVYHLYELTHAKKPRDIILSSLFMAAAIMTKGPFVAIIFGSSILGYLFLQGRWKALLHYKWGLVLVLTCLFIVPELYAVYQQFDMHPEKIVFGQHGVSGIHFFFWGSQFGRFSNTGPITIGTVDPFFFLHTLLWAFGPWSVIAYTALVRKTRDLFRFQKEQEYLTFFGFVVMFLIFSVSGTQLAHYTNILYPFLAIMTADLIINKMEGGIVKKVFLTSLLIFATAVPAIILLIAIVFIHKVEAVMIILVIITLLSLAFIIYRRRHWRDVVSGSVISICGLLLYLNTCFYPELHQYQAGSQAAFYIRDHYDSPPNIAYKHNWLFQFYTHNDAVGVSNLNEIQERFSTDAAVIVFADKALQEEISQSKIPYKEVGQFNDFRTSMITLNFFNHRTRPSTLEPYYLLSIQAP